MLEINGIFYYVDLKKLSDMISGVLDTNLDTLIISECEEKIIIHADGSETKEILTKKFLNPNDSKFKTSIVIDEFLKTVFLYKDFFMENDIESGVDNNFDDTQEQTSYKLAFNTLLMNGIIKEYKIK